MIECPGTQGRLVFVYPSTEVDPVDEFETGSDTEAKKRYVGTPGQGNRRLQLLTPSGWEDILFHDQETSDNTNYGLNC